MKILYFDVLSLFYSDEYFHRNASVHAKYKEWFNTRTKTLLEMVEPDFQAIGKALLPKSNELNHNLTIRSETFIY
ncbi:hypothetical protein D8T65_24610 [Vibrio vulnificus]|nr:hypothetical protein D8T65_24610 [Vibrio vulnificus]